MEIGAALLNTQATSSSRLAYSWKCGEKPRFLSIDAVPITARGTILLKAFRKDARATSSASQSKNDNGA